eukprot:SAG25_NODE_6012_length_596_cov_1.452716_1_plen_35_part_10
MHPHSHRQTSPLLPAQLLGRLGRWRRRRQVQLELP